MKKTINFLILLIFLTPLMPSFGQDQSETKDRERERKNYGTSHYFKIDLGTNNYLEDGNFPDKDNKPYSVKPFGSWYVALNSVNRTRIGGPLLFEWGGGVSWYNFKFENSETRIIKDETGLIFIDDPRNISPIKSKLTASYLNLHVVPVLDFGYTERKHHHIHIHRGHIDLHYPEKHGFRIGAGGYAGYRLGSHTKIKFDENGDTDIEKDDGSFFLQNLRYGVRVQIGFSHFDLFANYDLNELFSEGKGPELNAISFGFILL